MNSEVKQIRLASQQLSKQRYHSPQELVGWMGAMQAQDFGMAKWAIAIRLKDCSEKDIEDAYNRGDIIRTHIMRPTWHFVTSEDIRWIHQLSSCKVKSASNSLGRNLNIYEKEYTKAYWLFEKSLRDHNYLTKEEIGKILFQKGLTISPQHINRYLMRAEAEGIICSGALKNKKQTYALFDERVPYREQINREEALARLAKRYMQSHSPATLQDFVWWSGLTITDCKLALKLIDNDLIKDHFGTDDFYIHQHYKELNMPAEGLFHMLPAYDEYIISYKNRTNVLDLEHHSKAFNKYGIFQPIVLYNGHAVGNWEKSKKTNLDITFWDNRFKFDKKLLTQAEIKFQNYRNK